ncbi:MAG: type IV pilus assembly protein PilM [Actinobacteria bacterium]|nr:type IV pilus assembly protein PilM [Actinomycetota bacterium]
MAIGLDIGSSAVRAVQIERKRAGTLRLTRRGEVALPPEAVVDGDVVQPEVVTEALRGLWKRARFGQRTVAVGLASQRVTVRQIDLPDLADAELRDAVRLQAQDQLPMPIDRALLDHVVIERYEVGDDRRNVRVLLVAVDQELVDRILAAVTAAGLHPVGVDLDAFALIRSAMQTPDERVELIIDIGATVTTIALHRGGTPLFVRMVGLGGEGATRKLQEALDLDREGAEAAKLDASAAMAAGATLDPDDERVRMLHASAQQVVSEVQRSLDFFRTQHDDVPVQRAILSGGASLVPALAERLEAVLELPVDRHRANVQITASGAEPAGMLAPSASLAVAVGLALGSPQ